MPRPRSTQPTARELLVLRALWETPALTPAEIHERICHERPLAYVTVQGLLAIMQSKKLIRRSGRRYAPRFYAAVKEDLSQSSALGDVINRFFGGSVRRALLHAIDSGDISKVEAQKIRELLEKRPREG